MRCNLVTLHTIFCLHSHLCTSICKFQIRNRNPLSRSVVLDKTNVIIGVQISIHYLLFCTKRKINLISSSMDVINLESWRFSFIPQIQWWISPTRQMNDMIVLIVIFLLLFIPFILSHFDCVWIKKYIKPH